MFRVLQWSDSHHNDNAVNATNALIPTVPQLDLPIHCGDIVQDHYPQDLGSFDPTISACVLGNHDTIDKSGTNPNGYEWYKQPSQEILYQKYFTRMKPTFDVSLDVNTTWWSKEFTDKGILFLGLNDTVLDDVLTKELEFVNERISYAESKGYAIAVAKHGPSNMYNEVKCNFTATYMMSAAFTSDKVSYNDAYANGGEKLLSPIMHSKCKVLYVLAGHEHGDGFGYITRNDSSRVPYIHVGSGIVDIYNDVARGNTTVTSNVVCNMIDYVPEQDVLRIYRLGADASYGGIPRKMLTFSYGSNKIVSSCGVGE